MATYLRLALDATIAAFNLVAGKLLPEIKVPEKDLTGNIAIVTGANTGIGYEIALSLAKQNATVYLACRNRSKGEEAVSKIIDAGGRAHFVELDLSSIESIRAFQWSLNIDILVHNAGITHSVHGPEVVKMTNFVGSFMLTSQLRQHLGSARIVFTSSSGVYAARMGGRDGRIYATSKVQQVQFARALSRRGYTANAFTPGYCDTPLLGKLEKKPWYKEPLLSYVRACRKTSITSAQGAATGIWLCTTDDPKVKKGGIFWDRCIERYTEVDLLSEKGLVNLWDQWCEETGAVWS